MSTQAWITAPCEHLTRAERNALYGGPKYGGIQPSNTSLNVFLYSDPAAGGAIYPYDGWSSDNTVFLYTGEGQEGDQEVAFGNRALINHEDTGRALRLFVADGTVAGTSEKNHIYVGEFRVDPEDSYRVEPAPDVNEEERSVLVFRLLPVGEVCIRDQDRSGTGDAPSTVDAELIDTEQHNAPIYETAGTEPSQGMRRESDMVKRLEAQLVSAGHDVRRWRLRPAGELLSLRTDTYDVTARELFEGKGTSARNSVRLAVGQLLDYRRLIPESDLTLTVLLPSRPSDDVLSFIHSVDMGCMYEEGGAFHRA